MASTTSATAPPAEACPIKFNEVPDRGYVLKLGQGYEAIGYTMSEDDIGSGHYVSPAALNVCILLWERRHLGCQRQVMASLINGYELPDGSTKPFHPWLSKDAAIAEFYKLGNAAAHLDKEIEAKYQEYCQDRARQGFAVMPLPIFGLDTVTCPEVTLIEKQFDTFRAARLLSADVREGGVGYQEVYDALQMSGRPPVFGKFNTYDISGTMEERMIALKADETFWTTTILEQTVLSLQATMAEKILIRDELIVAKLKAYDFSNLPDTSNDYLVYYKGALDCQTKDVPTWLRGTDIKLPEKQWFDAVKAADDRICKYLKNKCLWDSSDARSYTNELTARGYTRSVAMDKLMEDYLEDIAMEERKAAKGTKRKRGKKA
ncbi:hypothetical protein BDZ45DRAFT_804560 [Acephala macrosclerotiorum]|nr:hypothetical protein BDZ45DRAFT_804560 [Acephala macrosclerotiorum]